jgi:hypothetical protein
MTLRSLALAAVCLFAAAQVTRAQPPPGSATAPGQPRASTPATLPTPAAAPAPAAPPPPPPRRAGQPLNVKVDVTISDQMSAAASAMKKTVSVVTGDSMNGFIRSNANYSEVGQVPLNVDAEPEILADGKIRLRLNLQYDLPVARQAEPGAGGALRKTELRENLALILENGKPIIAAQSADPVGDRQVTVEVKATILR